jgi:hypothetical protein
MSAAGDHGAVRPLDSGALLGPDHVDRLAGLVMNVLMELAELGERVRALEAKAAPGDAGAGDMQRRLDDLVARVLAAMDRRPGA